MTRFVEKPPADRVFTDQANAGVYVLEPEVFGFIPHTGECDFGHEVFPAILATLPGCLSATPLNGYLRDTGTPENYRQANWDAVSLHGVRAVSDSALIAPGATLSGRNVIGARCRIESGATLSESILWDGVSVGRGASVLGAVLGHGVSVGAGAVVGEGSLLADGARVLDGAILPPNSRLEPNEIVTK